MKEELISIIIPIFNAEHTIEKCLNSLRIQTYENIEIIMIDDGSTDRSFEICSKYLEYDSRFKLIKQKNKGVSSARNQGLKIAKGQYIAFVDPDDYVKNTYIMFLSNLIKRYDADIAICEYETIHKYSHRLENNTISHNKVFSREEAQLELLKFNGIFCGHVWDKLFKKKVIENIEFCTNIHCYEDLLFCWEAVENSRKIVYGDSKQYFYIQNSASILNRKYSSKYFSSFIALDSIFEKIRLEKNDKLKSIFELRYQNEIILQAGKCLNTLSIKEQREFVIGFLTCMAKYDDLSKLDVKTKFKWYLIYIYFKIIKAI